MKRPPTAAQLKEIEAINYAISKRDLGLYVQNAWDILEPGVKLRWNWHHDYICEHLQAAYNGEIKRLIINIAPRSTKSLMTTVAFPTWVWLNDPKMRFLFGSFSEDLATNHSILRRNLIESPWYQTGYSQLYSLSSDENTKSKFTNDHTGAMVCSGSKSAPTGLGGDFIIMDDPHNPKGAMSDPERDRVLREFDLGWSSRLNDKKTGRIIVIMQRLHEKDLTGHLLEKGGYTHIKIPTISEERTRLVYPVSGKVKTREQGELMHPERDGQKEIEQAKKDLGPYGFSGQHQQEPTPSTGGLFTSDQFDFLAPPPKLDFSFITADTAYSDAQSADFTVFCVWGVADNELYWIDCYRKQIKAADIENDVTPFIKRFITYGFRYVWIEPKGHGMYLNQALKKKSIPIPPEEKIKEFYADRRGDKVMRANNAVPYLAGRRVHINPMIAEKETLLSEVLRFPRAAHDDVTDCVIDGIKQAFARKVSLLEVL